MLSCRRQRAQLINGRRFAGTSLGDILGASLLIFQGDASVPATFATNFGFAGPARILAIV